jgi:hypothetical protein
VKPPEKGGGERCLNGTLKGITVTELLHFLSLHRKSGKLTLRRRQGSGLIVLRNGRIIYAASSSVREAFGNILLCHGLVSEATLTAALERQQWTGRDQRLGAVLIEMGALREEEVRDVVRYQVATVLAELDQWDDGFFRFDVLDIPERGEIEVDAQDFVVTEGLNTEEILMQVAVKLDEGGGAPGASASTPQSGAASEAHGTKGASLQQIVEELPTLVLHGEISQMIMRRASSSVNRGILFIVRGDVAVGIGHFGLPPRSTPGLEPEAFRLPLSKASVVSEVVQHQESYCGPLPSAPGNQRLIGLLGGGSPSEVLALPVVVAGRVELVLYGDNAPRDEPIGTYRSLELLLDEAGLRIEKDMIDARTRSLERARRDMEG